MQVVPFLLQRSQIRLELRLCLFVAHGEELPADLQGVDEAALVPLKQQLRVLGINKGRKEVEKKGRRREQTSQLFCVCGLMNEE